MSIVYRPYQQEAITKGASWLRNERSPSSIQVLPTGSGKSVIISGITKELNSNVLILQPSKEILVQNFDKYRTYGFYASIYSASVGRKEVSATTFATIGSIVKKPQLFRNTKYILIDECHLVNPNDGMYKKLLNSLSYCKVMGFTATPYRLSTDGFGGSMLKFITRTRPRIFETVNYYVQIRDLLNQGYLAKMDYYPYGDFDRSKIKLNSTGADFDEYSLRKYYDQIDFSARIVKTVLRLQEIRKNVLVFCRFIKEAKYVQSCIPGSVTVDSDTPSVERDKILRDFKAGRIKTVINVGVLTTGFDYPELETIVFARETMSLAMYYQIIGRGMRPHPFKKSCWVVDLCGNFKLFGRIEDLVIEPGVNNKWVITSNGIPLTNEYFSREDNIVDPQMFNRRTEPKPNNYRYG